jgi:hypothetical protein
MFNDNPDFYPTPLSVIEQMCMGVEIENKHILEPSAGKGNIIDYLKPLGAKISACEIHPDLALIVMSKADRFLKPDFLKVEQGDISHIDCIIMNPPFSKQEDHILHAWDIAPEGSRIISLCNHTSIERCNYTKQMKIYEIVKLHGSLERLGNVFDTAERSTNVTVGLINIFKPVTNPDIEFDEYFDMGDVYVEQSEEGLTQFNEINAIVGRYVGSIKIFDETIAATDKMNAMAGPINTYTNIHFGAFQSDRNSSLIQVSRETYKKELQKSAWRVVFQKFKIEKFMTTKVRETLNAFIEKQVHVPFTAKNIYRMIEMIIGTHKSRLEGVLVEAFERICSYAYTNSTAGEKWKTNSDYKVNRRFIHPYICEWDHRWPKHTVSLNCRSYDKLDDINKALCLLTGKNYENIISISNFFRYSYKLVIKGTTDYYGGYHGCDDKYESLDRYRKELEKKENISLEIIHHPPFEWGQWYEWGFFRVRGYKKGTMHFEFIDEKVWELFNRRVAEIKGWRLPRGTGDPAWSPSSHPSWSPSSPQKCTSVERYAPIEYIPQVEEIQQEVETHEEETPSCQSKISEANSSQIRVNSSLSEKYLQVEMAF